MNAQNIKLSIKEKIRARYSACPVVVQESPEDSEALWVQVFAVPVERIREVKDFILDLQDEIGDEVAILLPMVKNIEVTRKHYPQYAPLDVSSIMSTYVGMQTRYLHASYVFAPTASLEMSSFGVNCMRSGLLTGAKGALLPSSILAKAADTELALAA